ncbi:hypothetical protein J4Q44_G00289770 [Coregonus suidteri]|uniref:Ig-like domain-containing protein n=1 Tax=Coregonus suidteri TaxID=861788 RepID=A0AAN8KTN8_9TELE
MENYVSLSDDPDYKGRVTYRSDKRNGHTLKITDLRESDSTTYKFRLITDQTGGKYFGSPGVTLSVTDLQVKVIPATVTEGQKVTLTCSTTCILRDNPTYVWYKNGHVTNQSNSLFLNPVSSEDAGRYSCAVEGHEVLPSPEETLTVRYGPKNSSVSVSPSGKIVEGSSVTLTCSSDANPPVDKYTWYKKNGDSSPVYDNISGMAMTPTAAQTAATVDQDDVHYASIHFSRSKNQEVPLYSTVQLPQPQKQDEDVQYAAVKFNRPSAATRVHPDPNSDSYTALKMRTKGPDYDTLACEGLAQ